MHQVARWIAGVSMGSAAMFLLDPITGRRRRALLRDWLGRTSTRTGRGLRTTGRDLQHRMQGLAASWRQRQRAEWVDDDVLIARMRSRLGRVVSHPHAVEVAAHGGVVTLSGPVLADEITRLRSAARQVPGVQEVVDRLQVHRTADGVPALQGGHPRTGPRFELMQQRWSPSARAMLGGIGALATMTGASLLAARLTGAATPAPARAGMNARFRPGAGAPSGRRHGSSSIADIPDARAM